MPYQRNEELPESVRKVLPDHAQDIYRETFNNAWAEYKDPAKRRDATEDRERVSRRVAWQAVKKEYQKSPDGPWRLKQ